MADLRLRLAVTQDCHTSDETLRMADGKIQRAKSHSQSVASFSMTKGVLPVHLT
jgi:hypothetical protein